jgi:hypothetical protein
MHDPVQAMEKLYCELDLGDFETVRPLIEEYSERECGSLAGQRVNEMNTEAREEIRTRLEFVFRETGYPLEPSHSKTADAPENS